MKALIIFYSRTGTTKKLAGKIAEELKADIEEVIDLKDRSGVVGWLKAGRDAMEKKSADIKEISKNINDYDTVIIGSPVWAGSVTPAIRTFLVNNKNNIKKIAFFCTQGGNNHGKIFIQMEELINTKPLGILALSAKEVIKEMSKEKIESFIKTLK